MAREAANTLDGKADLLDSVTEAVNIVDRVLLPSVAIRVNLATSALLGLNFESATKLLCYCLMEASDYAAPDGKVSLSGGMREKRDSAPGGIRLSVEASRSQKSLDGLHPLEDYLARSLSSSFQKKAFADERISEQQDVQREASKEFYGEGIKRAFCDSS